MSDQSRGGPDSEEGAADHASTFDDPSFAPETDGLIDASSVPPPPPSMTDLDQAEPVPPSEQPDDAQPGAGDPSTADDVPWQVPNPTPPWSSSNPAAPAAPVEAAPAPFEVPGGGQPLPPPPPAPGPAPSSAPPPPPAPGAAPSSAPPPPPAPGAAPSSAPPPPPPSPAPPGAPPQSPAVSPSAPYGAPPPSAPYGAPPPPAYPPPGYVSGGQQPGYPGQVGAAPPYPQQPYGPQIIDPHGLGVVLNWLGSGSKRAGKQVFPVLASVLEDGDRVEIMVQGRVRGEPGVAALVGSKLVLVNARQWKPEVITLPISGTLQVQGFNHGHVASLLFSDGATQEMVDQIGDQQLAVPMAEQVRMRVAAAAGSGEREAAQPGGQPGVPSGSPLPPPPPPPAG